MQNTYEELIDLMTSWKAFKEESDQGNLHEFGSWLVMSKEKTQQKSKTKNFIFHESNELTNSESDRLTLANKAIIGSIVGRLNLFVKHYTKIPFKEIEINNMDEFKILSLIERLDHPNKTDLSEASLMEFSTINDMLKRFQQKNWIKQDQDQEDKRAKRIQLTPEGRKTLKIIYQKLSDVQPSITGDLNEEEQQHLVDLLTRLNQFHTHYFENHFKKHKSSHKK